MITAVIIDDEKHNRGIIFHMLKELELDVKIIGEADSVQTGIGEIRAKKPDLIFLDIRLKGGTGFQILAEFPSRSFEVLMVTAYPDDYSSQVKKLGLLYYIVKPISLKELRDAVLEIQEIVALKKLRRITKFKQILVPTRYGIKFVHIDEIAYCETVKSQKKTKIHLINNEEIIGGKNILFFEEQLRPFSFIRVHTAFLVNVNHIDEYHKGDGGYLKMKDGSTVGISRNNKKVFLEFIKKFYYDLNAPDE